MRVLVACEFSGVVRDAFIREGHDAWSCDLLPSDSDFGPHIQGDVLEVLDNGWDLMIAHPPCTYLCTGGMNWLNRNPSYRAEREKAVSFFMALINAPIPKIAVENPRGYMNSWYKKPNQTLWAWQFGHPFTKDICLWLKGLPLLEPTHRTKGITKRLDFWSSKRKIEGKDQKSVTFEGVANAMAHQWGNPKQTLLEEWIN